MRIQPEKIRRAFQAFDWKTLFLEELLWNRPRLVQPPIVGGATVREVAHLGQIPVYEILMGNTIPDTSTRREVHQQISMTTANCLLIFVDKARTQTLWLWAKREKGRFVYRESIYASGQNGDLFLSKLAALFVDIEESADSNSYSALQAGKLLQNALDVAAVSKKFYNDFQAVRGNILPFIHGIPNTKSGLPDVRTKTRYVTVLLNRLMFVYFLQKKGFLDNDVKYLENKLGALYKQKETFFSSFLKPLFFEAFATPDRSAELLKLVGDIPYLNGGLFLPHALEIEFPIEVDNEAFDIILKLFGDYHWYLNDRPEDDNPDDLRQLSPEVLGHIFEKFINDQKSAGAYYTPEQITDYLCERTIGDLLLDRVTWIEKGTLKRADSIIDLQIGLNETRANRILDELEKLRLLDPAVGSGAFLVAALKFLDDFYAAVYGWAKAHDKPDIANRALGDTKRHALPLYAIRRRIITENLYGVDLMEGAPDIARLRLFIALVQAAEKKEHLEPLPNIEFNILEGNSLIGMMSCEEADFVGGGLFIKQKFDELAAKKTNIIRTYKNADESIRPQLSKLKRDANEIREELRDICDEATVEQWNSFGIKRAGWKGLKRAINADDISELRAFHWGAEFPEVMQYGFDAIITNPPWEIWKPNDKEFFAPYSPEVSKKKMTIKEFQAEKERLLKQPDIAADYASYLAQFPHVSEYFRNSPSYTKQISVVNGKKAGTDINLYKLFLERCFEVLKPKGRCGIVIPSGIYNDLGATRLRQMLFGEAKVTGLFGLSNEKYIFDSIHHGFKICILSFVKDDETTVFPAAFRINPREAVNAEELDSIFHDRSLQVALNVQDIKKLSPETLSVIEFRGDLDVQIVNKLFEQPLLSTNMEGKWTLVLGREFDMTMDSHLFYKTEVGLPLWEGKMFHQFQNSDISPKYWLEEKQARKEILGKIPDKGQKLGYQSYRLAFRDVTATTNERTVIATVLAPGRFCPHTVSLEKIGHLSNPERLYLAAVFNSYPFDYLMRQRITSHVSYFYVYNSPVPRLTEKDEAFWPIVTRAAKLICTTPEFDDLAKAANIGNHSNGATDAGKRAMLRAELDALIAQLYCLNEEEFERVLSTFPLVPEPVKLATRNKFRDLNRGVFVP